MAKFNFDREDKLAASLGKAPFKPSEAHHLIPVEVFSANNKATPRTDNQKTAVSAITEGFSAYEAGRRLWRGQACISGRCGRADPPATARAGRIRWMTS